MRNRGPERTQGALERPVILGPPPPAQTTPHGIMYRFVNWGWSLYWLTHSASTLGDKGVWQDLDGGATENPASADPRTTGLLPAGHC